MASLMESMLKAHSDTEDDLFLGPLEHCFEQIGQRESFLEEHKEMDGNLQRVQKASHLREAQQRLLAAVAHSRRFDCESNCFPASRARAQAKTWLTSPKLDGSARARSGLAPAKQQRGQNRL